tara:strand:- start:11 stop:115 length:105 start_codon:yes stop_codon:yes gene_type:complete
MDIRDEIQKLKLEEAGSNSDINVINYRDLEVIFL